jgi:cellulose synthase/poly-beta-1,6-N-acetylglucosamine synthase-like glycosyltransferase
MFGLLYTGITLISVLVFVQSAHTLYLALYTWNRPPSDSRAPDDFTAPQLSFTVMLPARHEEDVIQMTIERVARAAPDASDSDYGDLLGRRPGHD